jgi:hypothetical protein
MTDLVAEGAGGPGPTVDMLIAQKTKSQCPPLVFFLSRFFFPVFHLDTDRNIISLEKNSNRNPVKQEVVKIVTSGNLLASVQRHRHSEDCKNANASNPVMQQYSSLQSGHAVPSSHEEHYSSLQSGHCSPKQP